MTEVLDDMNNNMNRLQLTELEILLAVDNICKKYNIDYFLDSGTALGAIRHHGFIPWDDDIDIGMLREDYDRFISIAQSELGEKYFLQTFSSDPGCPCLFAKVRKNGTSVIENNKQGMKMHTGIWIDIFPFDSLPKSHNLTIIKLKLVGIIKNVFLIRKIPHSNAGNKGLKKYIKVAIRKLLHYIFLIIPESILIIIIDKIIESGNNDSSNVTCYFYGKPIIFEKAKLVPTHLVSFENYEFPIVNDTDYYLTLSYGDYMKLPPLSEQKGHSPLSIDYGD